MLTRDSDVLDTWFSSALWPFSTLGWPERTPELARYYPTDVLVTGFDIIFFWVARMMMMGLYFMKDVPFRTVYVHALVRDEKGQKMSKSKGNVIDPLKLIDKYGADALRFTLTAMAAQGRDIKLSESRVEGYRNFSTKIWNAARFCEMNGCKLVDGFDPAGVRNVVNRWIVSRLGTAIGEVEQGLEAYRFNEAAGALYQFAWGIYCDWYLEFAKPLFQASDADVVAETRATAAWVLGQLLHALHPMMPFMTEELWEHLTGSRGKPLIAADWPKATASADDAAEEMDWVVRLIGDVRTTRAELNVPPGAELPLLLKDIDAAAKRRIETHDALIRRLARLASIAPLSGEMPRGAVQIVIGTTTVVLPLAGVVDVAKEKARLEKDDSKLAGETIKIEKKLNNADFVAKAPEEVVEENRERLNALAAQRAKIREALARLEAL